MNSKKTTEELSTIALKILDENSISRAPVDIDFIIESSGLEMIPIPGLRRLTQLSGALSSDFQSIYYDQSEADRNPFRMRFTLAHEFAHFILHRNLINEQDLNGIKFWKKAFLRINKYGYIETEANYLASFLLVPKFLLKPEMDLGNDTYSMHKLFEVSTHSMEHRVTNFKYKNV